jgi:hypothetical protein
MFLKYIANPVEVEAFKIVSVGTQREDGETPFCTDDGKNRMADHGMTARYLMEPGDYLVIQSDGYEYLNPKDVFERKYTPKA